MNADNKSARDWLLASSRRSFYDVLKEAKITPRQQEIAELRFVEGLLNYQIAMKLNVSVKTVEKELQSAYKAVNRILDKLI